MLLKLAQREYAFERTFLRIWIVIPDYEVLLSVLRLHRSIGVTLLPNYS